MGEEIVKYLFFILFPLCANAQSDAQTVQIIDGAKAWKSTLINFGTPFYERIPSGDTITFIFQYHADINTSLDVFRINLSKGTSTSKSVTGTRSNIAALWLYASDSVGNIFVGLNSDNRKIYRFNFNDSIYFKDLGNGFLDGTGLAYSYGLGTDANVCFGESSTPTPSVSYWDHNSDAIIKYPAPDSNQDYVLSVQADSNFIYAQTGQRTTNDIWAIRKSDGAKQKILSVPNTTRFNTKTWLGHCYASSQGISYQLNGFNTPTVIAYWNALNYNQVYGIQTITSYYNSASNALLFYGSSSGSIAISTDILPSNIKIIFFDSSHIGGYDSGFYYVGDYYGNWYHYNNTTHTSTSLGSLAGYNVFSVLQYNDSIFYLACYPDATVWKWNKNQPWTENTFVNGRLINGSLITDNPHIENHLRTYGGFHEPREMISDSAGNIVAFGDVIRVDNTCSIAAFNPVTHAAWGYNFNKIDRLGGVDIERYKDHILFSTNNTYGGHAKLYWYNSVANTMDDSLDQNYNSYRALVRHGDTLFAIDAAAAYKMYLPTKTILATYSVQNTSILALQYGFMGLNTNQALLDSNYFIRLHYSNAFARDSSMYTIAGTTVSKISNFYPPAPPVIRDTIHPTPDNQAIIFYPNPATNQVYVIGSGKFYLLSNTGAFIASREGSGVFNLSVLAAGTYYINFKRLSKR